MVIIYYNRNTHFLDFKRKWKPTNLKYVCLTLKVSGGMLKPPVKGLEEVGGENVN